MHCIIRCKGKKQNAVVSSRNVTTIYKKILYGKTSSEFQTKDV
jgi:hypothetical protein